MELGKSTRIERVRSTGSREEKQDIIPHEILLHLFLNQEKVSTVSCSPGNLIELVTGYIVSNGYINSYQEINLINICDQKDNFTAVSSKQGFIPENKVVRVNANIDSKSKVMAQTRYLSPGCGSFDDEVTSGTLKSIDSKVEVCSRIILGLNKKTVSRQKNKSAFGGLHSAALYNAEGKMFVIMEDIGRHNCIDKVFGHILVKGMNTDGMIVFTSGRISLDLVFKASRMSVPVIVTNSSITYSAARLAKKIGLTLIGYARGNRFNIYSRPERII